jgi:hypothetical protein
VTHSSNITAFVLGLYSTYEREYGNFLLQKILIIYGSRENRAKKFPLAHYSDYQLLADLEGYFFPLYLNALRSISNPLSLKKISPH